MTVEHPSVLIKKIMEDNSYTVQEFARITGISKAEIRNIVSRRNGVGRINGEKLEKTLGMPKELFTAWSVTNKKKKIKAKRIEIKKKPKSYADYLQESNKLHGMSDKDNKKDVNINLRAFK